MRKSTLLFSFLLLLCLPIFSQGFGDNQLFNDNWRFHLGDVKYGGKEYMDISGWSKVDLPHDWTVLQTASPQYAACTGFLPGGIGWYRKEFDVSSLKQDQKVFIYFEGVYNNSEVFVNGKFLGKRPNGYISFMYDLTPYLKQSQKNSIAVRVDHSKDADSRWYTGSGIYRNVRLVYANPVHIAQWGVFHKADVTKKQATVNVQTSLVNETDKPATVKVVQQLFDPSGKKVASAEKQTRLQNKEIINQVMNVSNPQLWDTEHPNLYRLVTRIYQDGKQVDETSSAMGLRYLNFDANTGFSLNGKPMKVKGVCLHHDAGSLGAAVPKEVWTYRLQQLKSIGCNAIRTSHNPVSTELLEACDESGLMVMAEAFDEWEYPKKKWLEGWNVGEPGFQGSADYFRDWSKRDLQDMILRDRNHPSVVMWSIGNEVDYPNDPYSHPVLDNASIGQAHVKGYLESQPRAERLGDIAKELAAVARQCDTSRPVTAALAGAVMSNSTDYPGALDIVGYNYTEDRYQTDHKTYPKRVLYGSENRHDFEAWKAVRDNEFIFGQFLWTGFDYLGEAGVWPSRGFTTGLIDLAGNVKPMGYFRNGLWAETPTAYIGTYPANPNDLYSIYAPQVWNYEPGQEIRVVCYTNCDEAELTLNGRTVGERQKYNDQTGVMGWTIPYEAGSLQVKTYKDGKEVAENTIESTGRPYALKAELLNDNRKPGIRMIMITVVDENGKTVVLADNDISFDLSGSGKIMATENARPDASDNYHDNHHRVYNGKLLVYVKTTGENDGELRVSSPLLKGNAVKL